MSAGQEELQVISMTELILMEGSAWTAGVKNNRAKQSIKAVKEDELRNSNPFMIDLSV